MPGEKGFERWDRDHPHVSVKEHNSSLDLLEAIGGSIPGPGLNIVKDPAGWYWELTVGQAVPCSLVLTPSSGIPPATRVGDDLTLGKTDSAVLCETDAAGTGMAPGFFGLTEAYNLEVAFAIPPNQILPALNVDGFLIVLCQNQIFPMISGAGGIPAGGNAVCTFKPDTGDVVGAVSTVVYNDYPDDVAGSVFIKVHPRKGKLWVLTATCPKNPPAPVLPPGGGGGGGGIVIGGDATVPGGGGGEAIPKGAPPPPIGDPTDGNRPVYDPPPSYIDVVEELREQARQDHGDFSMDLGLGGRGFHTGAGAPPPVGLPPGTRSSGLSSNTAAGQDGSALFPTPHGSPIFGALTDGIGPYPWHLAAASGPAFFNSTNAGSPTAHSSVLISYPSSISAGDLLVLVAVTAQPGITTPSGFTQIGSFGGYGPSGTQSATFYRRIATGSESGFVTVQPLVGPSNINATMIHLSGNNVTTPFDGSAQDLANAGGSSLTHSAPAATTTGANRIAIAFGIQCGSSFSCTGVSVGWTQRTNDNYGPAGITIATRPVASAGSTGSCTFTYTNSFGNNSSNDFTGFTLTVEP